MSSSTVIGSVISVSMGPPASYRCGYISLSKVRDAKFYIYVNSYIWYTICRKKHFAETHHFVWKETARKNEESCNFVWYFPWYVYSSTHSKILLLENYIWVILFETCMKLNAEILLLLIIRPLLALQYHGLFIGRKLTVLKAYIRFISIYNLHYTFINITQYLILDWLLVENGRNWQPI